MKRGQSVFPHRCRRGHFGRIGMWIVFQEQPVASTTEYVQGWPINSHFSSSGAQACIDTEALSLRGPPIYCPCDVLLLQFT